MLWPFVVWSFVKLGSLGSQNLRVLYVIFNLNSNAKLHLLQVRLSYPLSHAIPNIQQLYRQAVMLQVRAIIIDANSLETTNCQAERVASNEYPCLCNSDIMYLPYVQCEQCLQVMLCCLWTFCVWYHFTMLYTNWFALCCRLVDRVYHLLFNLHCEDTFGAIRRARHWSAFWHVLPPYMFGRVHSCSHSLRVQTGQTSRGQPKMNINVVLR